MESEESLRRYYAARAQEYDAVYAKPERQADLRIMEDRVPDIMSGKRILEVACGTGYWTQFFGSSSGFYPCHGCG